MALAVPLSRFTSRVGGGSAFFVRRIQIMRVCLLFLMLLAGCATRHDADWHIQDAGAFTFSLPFGFQKTSVHGIDSYVSEFESQDMTVGFDYGAYSGESLDSLAKSPGYTSQMERIGGRDVQIVSVDVAPSSNHRHFEHLILASFLKAGLTMSAWCNTTTDYDTATKIFRSVRFK